MIKTKVETKEKYKGNKSWLKKEREIKIRKIKVKEHRQEKKKIIMITEPLSQ